MAHLRAVAAPHEDLLLFLALRCARAAGLFGGGAPGIHIGDVPNLCLLAAGRARHMPVSLYMRKIQEGSRSSCSFSIRTPITQPQSPSLLASLMHSPLQLIQKTVHSLSYDRSTSYMPMIHTLPELRYAARAQARCWRSPLARAQRGPRGPCGT